MPETDNEVSSTVTANEIPAAVEDDQTTLKQRLLHWRRFMYTVLIIGAMMALTVLILFLRAK